MSDLNDFEYDDEEQQDQPSRNPLRQAMKQKEKENAELAKRLAEAESAKRELNFMKAGVNPDEPKFKYFVKAYDGDLSPEAIKQALIEAQLMSPENQIPENEAGAWGATDSAASGSHVTTPAPDLATRISRAKTEQEIMEILAEAQASQ